MVKRVLSVDQKDALNVSIPLVSDDQTGCMSNNNKRMSETVIDVDSYTPGSKRARIDSLTARNTNNVILDIESSEGDILSPNSRWQAMNLLLSWKLLQANLWVNLIAEVWSRHPLDLMLMPCIHLAWMTISSHWSKASPSQTSHWKRSRTIYSGCFRSFVYCIRDSTELCNTEGVVEMDKESVLNFLTCIKHAMLLSGDASARISVNRRELV